jgi:hypothetical protein
MSTTSASEPRDKRVATKSGSKSALVIWEWRAREVVGWLSSESRRSEYESKGAGGSDVLEMHGPEMGASVRGVSQMGMSESWDLGDEKYR